MKIEYTHGSKYGNGALIADEFKRQMAARGILVNVHHVRDVRPREIQPADLYVFSSPGRFGKPVGEMRKFLKAVTIPPGTRYALMVTELAPKPEVQERMPTEDKAGACQRVIPIMDELLQEKGLVKVAEGKIFVTGLKGPLEKDWQKHVEAFASRIPVPPPHATGDESSADARVVSVV